MTAIFICQRDGSSGYAVPLFNALRDHFRGDRVFMGADGSVPEAEVAQLLSQVGGCDALLVLIDQRWLTSRSADRSWWLEEPHDPVRREIEAALACPNIRLIPVLLHGATMPNPQELPEAVRVLATRQAFLLRDDAWERDVAELIKTLVSLPPARPRISLANASRIQVLHTLVGYTNFVSTVAFTPDSRVLATGGADNTVRLWQAADGTLLRTMAGHTARVTRVAFTPGGRELASASADGTVRLWRLDDATLLRELRGNPTWVGWLHQHFAGEVLEIVSSVAFSPDGQTLAAGQCDGNITVWGVADGRRLHRLRGHRDRVTSVAFTPDGIMLGSGSWDGTVRIWRVVDGRLLYTVTDPTLQGRPRVSLALAHHLKPTWWVNDLVFTPDGRTFVTASGGATVRLWRVPDGTPLRTLIGHDAQVQSGASAATGVGLGSQAPLMGGVTCTAISPDGDLLASGADDYTVRLWHMADGALWHVLEGHSAGVTSVAFAPDGATLASGSWDGKVLLWGVS